jgi:hypothetical protein
MDGRGVRRRIGAKAAPLQGRPAEQEKHMKRQPDPMRREDVSGRATGGKTMRKERFIGMALAMACVWTGCATKGDLRRSQEQVNGDFMRVQDQVITDLRRSQEQVNKELRRMQEQAAALEKKVDALQSSSTASVSDLDRQVQRLAGEQRQLAESLKTTGASLAQDIRTLTSDKANAADLATARESLNRQATELEGRKADRTDIDRLSREKVSVADIERLGLDEIRRRLTAAEYQVRSQREELLTSASTGYRNAVQASRDCVVEIEPMISRIIEGKEKDCSVFIRDFRGLDDRVTVFGDLLSREFTSFMKARSGLDRSLYREEFVIGLYQDKKLQVPAKEAFNLENLERGGFPTKSVLIISGRLTPTATAYRLDVEVTDLKDPQFRASASRLIPKDSDINQMNEQTLKNRPDSR